MAAVGVGSVRRAIWRTARGFASVPVSIGIIVRACSTGRVLLRKLIDQTGVQNDVQLQPAS